MDDVKTLNRALTESTSEHNSTVALIQPSTGERMTFGQLRAALSGVHRLLEEHQVSKGDVVTLIGANSIDLAVMLYGVMTFGAIAKPLNPGITAPELTQLLSHSGSSIIFSDRSVVISDYKGKRLDLGRYRKTGGDGNFISRFETTDTPALLIYTSGTTSQPKGVLLSHGNIVHNVQTAIRVFQLESGHTKICILPLFHTFGFISDLSTMALCGGTTAILDVFDVTKLAAVDDAIHTYGVNSFSAVPLMFELFLRFGCDLAAKQMRFCVSGAAPLRDNVASEFLQKYKFPIIPAYGLTETTCFATISPPARIKPGSAGTPAAVIARVAGDDGEEIANGEIGEILLSGESVMRQGYFKNDIPCFQGEGNRWFKTGDLGYRDEDGYIYVTGRLKNMVIRGGEKIYLEDIDACLREMKLLADNASVRFEEDGEDKIAIFAVPKDGTKVTDFEVKSFLEKQLGRLKSPDVVMLTTHIPRTATNKVKIRELRELIQRAEARSASV
jgi:long-chain acyl-CoA synthetase